MSKIFCLVKSLKDGYCYEDDNYIPLVQPFPKRQILDSFKLRDLAVDNFNFDENDRKFSAWEENTLGKGEIDCYKQFLLFPQCFQMSSTSDM